MKKSLIIISVLSFLLANQNSFSQKSVEETNIDHSLQVPVVNTNPLPKYRYDNLDYGMTLGIESTKNGRIWAAWIGGGDNEEAFLLLNRSDDNGKTWSDPKVVIDPQSPNLEERRRALVGNLWLDPNGHLWLFFDQALSYFDGRSGVWYTKSENPDDETPKWSKPVRIWHGATLNKPIILKDGSWLLPISLWDRAKIKSTTFKNSHTDLDSLRMAHVFISRDQGKNWSKQGGMTFPEPQFDEHCLVELNDGRIWMTARTRIGIYQSYSADKGKTWTDPEFYLPHIGSRHFIRRLQSGNLLMIKHGDLDEKTFTRSKLSAYLSRDEGGSWEGKLVIDERRGVSYPDGFQSADGTINISYDRNRATDGEILMAQFTEEDILKGKFQGKNSHQKILINKPLGLDKLPLPSDK